MDKPKMGDALKKDIQNSAKGPVDTSKLDAKVEAQAHANIDQAKLLNSIKKQ